jgi:hypothetical protein
MTASSIFKGAGKNFLIKVGIAVVFFAAMISYRVFTGRDSHLTVAHSDGLPINCNDHNMLEDFISNVNKSNNSKANGNEITDIKNIKTISSTTDRLSCSGTIEYNDNTSEDSTFGLEKNSLGDVNWYIHQN